MVTCIVVQNCERQIFKPLSPHAIFKFVLGDACVRFSFHINCECLIGTHFTVFPKICVISTYIVEVKAVLLSAISVIGRYACLLLMSTITFARLVADASVRRYANKQREKTYMASITLSCPPLQRRFSKRSICTASSGPIPAK